MLIPSRRQFLAGTASAAALAALPLPCALAIDAIAAPTLLRVERRTLEILGRSASVFALTNPAGGPGLTLDPGQRFRVTLENGLDEPTLIHWHGQTPPLNQDGVPELSQAALAPGGRHDYDFAARPGTHWMHSHHGLQEQRLLAAPLIVRTEEDRRSDEREVVMLLHDFTFKAPEEILAALTSGGGDHDGGHGGKPAARLDPVGDPRIMHGMGTMPMTPPEESQQMADMTRMMREMQRAQPSAGADPHAGHAAPQPAAMTGMTGMTDPDGHAMAAGMAHDLNDVDYDAYLANDRTLEDPEVVAVEKGGRVRLRIINGATSTAFLIDLGDLTGEVVAVDGNPVLPVKGRRFPMSMGQRLDIRVRLPADGGAFPILALREGARQRAGLILATAGAAVAKVAIAGDETPDAIGHELEGRLRAVTSLADRPVDRRHEVLLTGTMSPYVWSIDQRTWGRHRPLAVRAGERVEVAFHNMSDMAHPMHLHGHHFQVAALNGVPIQGAVRDTLLLPAKSRATVVFDADNPGRWVLHCHNLLHMATGMMTEVAYEA